MYFSQHLGMNVLTKISHFHIWVLKLA